MSKTKKIERDPGESYVWFTSLGLAVAIIMVIFLLGLVLTNGLGTLWPKRVVMLKLKADSSFKVGTTDFIAGEVVGKGYKSMPGRPGAKDISGREERLEWQLFTGNRDAYGFSFKFIDDSAIDEATYPETLMLFERREYGDAIGVPESLILGDGKTILAAQKEFYQVLQDLVRDAGTRWEEIHEIEKYNIGKVNAKTEKLRLKKKALLNDGVQSDAKAILDIETREEALSKEYSVLAAQAQKLRAEQKLGKLNLKLVSGESKAIIISDIVDYYQPNKLGLFSRLGRFVLNGYRLLADDPREANTEGGIFPAIFGTFVMTLLMSIAVMPFGVIAAVYLCEYAKQGAFVRMVRISVNNLAGVPSIVFGVFGLGFFVYTVGGSIDKVFFADALPTPTFGTGGIIWASLTLALMTVPVVIVATEEALMAVPRGVRESSLACGASKWQTISRLVLPAASPGIITGLILAMARGASEVAPLMLVGVVKLAPSLPVDGVFPFIHLERKFMHLAFYIYDLGFQSPDSDAAKPMVFTTTLVLIGLVLVLNVVANRIRNRLRKKNETKGF